MSRALAKAGARQTPRSLFEQLRKAGQSDDERRFAENCAQSAACALAAAELAPDVLRRGEVIAWLARSADPLATHLLSCCFANSAGGAVERSFFGVDLVARWRAADLPRAIFDYQQAAAEGAAGLQLYEDFLSHFNGGRRRRRGVYFTPRAAARYVAHRVDRSLREDFGLSDGLASMASWCDVAAGSSRGELRPPADDSLPFVRILDPAAGAGVFLVEVITNVRRTMEKQWRAAGVAVTEKQRRWNEYTRRWLLPRIVGYELMPAACLLARMNIAVELARGGFDFQDCPPPPVMIRDALRPPPTSETPFPVVVGNPPYAAVSHNQHRWIEQLLKGRRPDGSAAASYYEVDGRPLGERKLWLHDDYVKFMRCAHAHIEEAGCGIVAMVTNHSYFDNITFRGMRQQLMRDFPLIDLLDLHGNRKKAERTPGGERDENVFEIEQGVAISILRRPARATAPQVCYSELWGPRAGKLRELSKAARANGKPTTALPARQLSPAAPHYFFTPRDELRSAEYERGFRLVDIMPVNTTAPVTARDGFVVAMTREELLGRMAVFRDLSISDDEIRRRYFAEARSAKYPAGDTRGWKLVDARRRAAADPQWRTRVERCLYRPFDWRFVYWADWMIDWPRTDVSRHLLAGDNLALLSRRQMLAARPCDYFWVADAIALDGVIRNDNRGSESLFPLYLDNDSTDGQCADNPGSARLPNFDNRFVNAVAASTGLAWTPAENGDLRTTFGPEDLLHYIYACFFSSQYRQRYAECIRVDFPRVFAPRSITLFVALSQAGAQLVRLHLLRNVTERAAEPSLTERRVAPGFPKHQGNGVAINSQSSFPNVSTDVWNFQAGAHQVCRKWLRDRRGREVTPEEVQHYLAITAAITGTIATTRAIDTAIEEHGDWPGAFSLAEPVH